MLGGHAHTLAHTSDQARQRLAKLLLATKTIFNGIGIGIFFCKNHIFWPIFICCRREKI